MRKTAGIWRGYTVVLLYVLVEEMNVRSQKGNLFTQRSRYSIDGGKTLIKSDRFVLPHIEGENRDPKIFWHGATESYICVL